MDAKGDLLTETDELAEACEELRAGGLVAVDTEFRRESTYRPELCLVQLAGWDGHVLVDAIACQDLEPLRVLFADPAVEKVLHSARQDLEIFWMLWEELPRPLFDTQVAAALLGHGDNLGYGAVVSQVLGVELDKGHARTDWTRRPLRPEQLAYAAADVIHLVDVHELLSERLEKEGRTAWHAAEVERLLDPGLYRMNPDEAWQTVKGQGRLRAEERRVVRALAAWRERRAAENDRPRRWILSDEAVLELARLRPSDLRELEKVGSLPEGLRLRQGEALVGVVRSGLESREPVGPAPGAGGRLEPGEQRLVDEMVEIVRRAAVRHGVAQSLLAPRADLVALVRETDSSRVPAFGGWRGELVGDELTELLRSRLGG